jgi:TP901-1 family phage major tail protein
MAVGGGVIGRNITLTMGGSPVAGVTTKSITINNEPVDVSTDDANGWRELLADPGSRAMDISLSGVTKDLSLMRSAIENSSQVYTLVFTYPDAATGSTVTLDGFLASYAATGEYNGAETFEASFQSTGDYTFTAGS